MPPDDDGIIRDVRLLGGGRYPFDLEDARVLLRIVGDHDEALGLRIAVAFLLQMEGSVG
jgi:hypothetical protein